MKKLFRLLILGLISSCLVALSASAATITASSSILSNGQSAALDLVLDPEGVDVGAYLVALGTAGGLVIDGISAVTGSTGCSSLVSASSFDGQCIPAIPGGATPIIATVQVTATAPGGQLLLVSGNITDDNTFMDIPFAATVLATVPEPRIVGLLALALGFSVVRARGGHLGFGR